TDRVDFSRGPLVPARSRARDEWIAQRVTVAALSDAHLVGAGEPIAFASGEAPIRYAADGKAMVAGALVRGDSYTVWSTPADPARSRPSYPAALLRAGYLDFENGIRFPLYGAPGRRPALEAIGGGYARMGAQAELVAGDAPGPYAAAVALEGWFRRSGGFRYD